MGSRESNSQHLPADFETTQWTRVLACQGTSPESEQAVRDLCQRYYRPVSEFIRQTCQRGTPQAQCDAEDLTQEFFTRLLSGCGVTGANRSKGRFRAFLLGAVKHFLMDMRDQQNAAKRGGGKKIFSLDQSAESTRPCKSAGNENSIAESIEDSNAFPSDAFFDRRWAIELLERVIESLTHEYRTSNREDLFHALRPTLMGAAYDPTLISALGLSDGAIKVAVCRLRKCFRQVLRAEIAKTVEHPNDIEPEIQYLLDSLAEGRHSSQ